MKRLISLIAVLLLLGIVFPSAFANQAPDMSKTGSILFNMDWNHKPLNDGSLTLYRIGDIVEENGDYSFALIEELEGLIEELEGNNIVREKLDDHIFAQKLATLARKKPMQGTVVKIKEGEARFTELKLGLYVVTQSVTEATEGFAPIDPFLISVPQWVNGIYVYDLTADPKVPLVPESTEPPKETQPKPGDPELPQTGQNNWPVPFMAGAGLILLFVGFVLRYGGKEEWHEI